MATTYDVSRQAPSASPTTSRPFWIRGRMDIPRIQRENNYAWANGDSALVCKLPANCLVLAGYYKVVTTGTAGDTADIGSAVAGTQYGSNLALQPAGNWTILTDPNFNSDDFDEVTSETSVYITPDQAWTGSAYPVVDVMFLCVMTNDAFMDA